jgi:hypothetical protein
VKDLALMIGLIVLARLAFYVANRDAQQRHARWRMRAKLADWVYRDKLTPVKGVRNGKILR